MRYKFHSYEYLFYSFTEENMDCEALFAESDDEIEVLPSNSDIMPTSINRHSPKPNVSSNFLYSTAPHQSYEVNVEPAPHPNSHHTPVPEEYQPLPDSSSSFEYMMNASGVNNDGHRFPHVNIRYQPKPVVSHQREYYYQHYPPNAGTVPPPREYLVTPYPTNNIIVLNDDRGYIHQPMAYTLQTNPQFRENHVPHRGYIGLQPDVSSRYSHLATSSSEQNGVSHLPLSPERPSRKLNISPRRRQSRETDNSSNLIVVSSEEEDNVISSIKSCPDDNNCSLPVRNDVLNNSANSRNMAASSRTDIKRELDDRAGPTAQASGDANVQRNQNQTIAQPHHSSCSRRQSNGQKCQHMPAPHQHSNFCTPNACTVYIKQENNGDTVSSEGCRVSCSHSGCAVSSHMNAECPRHSSSSNYQNGSQNLHCNHNHNKVVRKSSNNSDSSPDNSNSLSPIKEEPDSRPQNVKQEAQFSQYNNADGTQNHSAASTAVAGPSNQSLVKSEPNVQRAGSYEEGKDNINIKSETDDCKRLCYGIDAGGDRKAKQQSPQPGTSSGRSAAPNNKHSTGVSTHQVNMH